MNKDIYGEVFTPSTVVKELLDQLPQSIWKNPKLCWLDPCAGEGVFFEHVLERLTRGLSSHIPDKKQRRNHIVQKMLFMCEINPDNIFILKSKFGKKANVYGTDFLEIKAFQSPIDVIVANPPFQSPKKRMYIGSVGNRTLWDKFILHSLSLLQPEGHLAVITPSNWRRPEHPLYNILTRENKLLYLHIMGKKEAHNTFGIQSRIDLYIIKKESTLTCTTYYPYIIDELGRTHRDIDILLWSFLPNYAYRKISSYLGKTKRIVIHDSSMYDARHLSKRKTLKYKYPVIHTLNQKGMGVLYAKQDLGHFGIPKVILNVNEKQYPVNDYHGKYGMSQLSFGIPIQSRKEGDKIINEIYSEDFQEVLKATKWGAFQTDHRMFKYIGF
jgi:hypothetical protein